MAKDGYVYAVTRVHTHEQNLLSGKDVDALVAASGVEEVMRLLADKGWETSAGPAGMLATERARTWELMAELVKDSAAEFDVFRVANDYHNLKAAIKLEYTANGSAPNDDYFQPFGAIDRAVIVKAAKEHDFSALPDRMAEAGREAYEVLAHSGNGQACDLVIDKAALVAVDEAGKATESELLRNYAQLTVDLANIKAAVRCRLMNKDADFIERAIAPAGTLDADALKKAASESLDEIYRVLRASRYANAVDALENSMTAFELWCNNRMMELIRPQRHNYFSIEPLAAYILARDNEVAMVRIILSAKMNNLGDEVLRERLREMYV